MAIHVVKEPVPKPGTLGRTELYALAIGQVIGAGVITLIVPAIKMTGYSAWLAYFVAILMGFVMILPFVFISSTLRLGGGNYSIKMPKKYPDAWKQSRYHVPDGLYYTICCVSLALFLVVLWKSLLSMNIGLAVINVVVIVIAGLIGFWRSKTGNIEIHTSVWAEDYQEAAES